MTLTEAIASVGVGRPESAKSIFRYKRKDYRTGKFVYTYAPGEWTLAAYQVVGWVKRDKDGAPSHVVASIVCTKAEREEVEAFRFEEAAK